MDNGKIAGRTVVITGAASGIGRALALGFLTDGAKVIAADIVEEGLAPIAAAGATPVRVDVTVEADVQRMIQFALSRLFGSAPYEDDLNDWRCRSHRRLSAARVGGKVQASAV